MNNEPLILAVDDEPGVLRLIKLELSSQGLRVVTASDGEEAMRIAEQQRPDMVILDIMMPDISGLEVMRRMRERSSVPVILLTAKDHRSEERRVGKECRSRAAPYHEKKKKEEGMRGCYRAPSV